MKNLILVFTVVFFALAGSAFGQAAATGGGIEIVNDAGVKTKLTRADIGKLKRLTIKVSDHGKDAVFEGVSLPEVLALGGVEFGDKIKGKRLVSYVLAEAADKYRAVYAIAEFDPGFTDRVILLADTRDGKALPDNAGDWQVVVPGEKKAGRWVRQVIRFTVVNVR